MKTIQWVLGVCGISLLSGCYGGEYEEGAPEEDVGETAEPLWGSWTDAVGTLHPIWSDLIVGMATLGDPSTGQEKVWTWYTDNTVCVGDLQVTCRQGWTNYTAPAPVSMIRAVARTNPGVYVAWYSDKTFSASTNANNLGTTRSAFYSGSFTMDQLIDADSHPNDYNRFYYYWKTASGDVMRTIGIGSNCCSISGPTRVVYNRTYGPIVGITFDNSWDSSVGGTRILTYYSSGYFNWSRNTLDLDYPYYY